jgi:DNA-binding CsgD family transcriptional regulator
MDDRPSSPHPFPEGSTLTPRELQVAILAVQGMTSEAIHRQVLLSRLRVEVLLYDVFKKMAASLNVPVSGLRRRDLHDWMSQSGLLPVEGDLEAVLAPTISALEAELRAEVWVEPQRRAGVEKDLAERKTALGESQRAMQSRESLHDD